MGTDELSGKPDEMLLWGEGGLGLGLGGVYLKWTGIPFREGVVLLLPS